MDIHKLFEEVKKVNGGYLPILSDEKYKELAESYVEYWKDDGDESNITNEDFGFPKFSQLTDEEIKVFKLYMIKLQSNCAEENKFDFSSYTWHERLEDYIEAKEKDKNNSWEKDEYRYNPYTDRDVVEFSFIFDKWWYF